MKNLTSKIVLVIVFKHVQSLKYLNRLFETLRQCVRMSVYL